MRSSWICPRNSLAQRAVRRAGAARRDVQRAAAGRFHRVQLPHHPQREIGGRAAGARGAGAAVGGALRPLGRVAARPRAHSRDRASGEERPALGRGCRSAVAAAAMSARSTVCWSRGFGSARSSPRSASAPSFTGSGSGTPAASRSTATCRRLPGDCLDAVRRAVPGIRDAVIAVRCGWCSATCRPAAACT